MDLKEFQSILTIGETVAVEFKRCGNGIESDTYETVCSFLNRFGGDIFMGVLDDGTVVGIPEKAAPDMVKNFITVISNPALFSPTIYLAPEVIKDEQGHSIIHVHIPPSAEVHSYKKVVYDREIVKTNLIESYEQLLEFGRKHLPDKFFLEDTMNKSLRNILVREMVSNTLMHREFTSSYTAKFVIEKDRMYVENANRASKTGSITVDNLEPNSKNPLIAAFFRNIGYADQLGSGVKKLFEYSKYYSGKEPQFLEDDIFRIIVPLDESYSYDYAIFNRKNGVSDTEVDTIDTNKDTNDLKMSLLLYIKQNASCTQKEYADKLAVSLPTVKRLFAKLQKDNLLVREGTNRKGCWKIMEK